MECQQRRKPSWFYKKVLLPSGLQPLDERKSVEYVSTKEIGTLTKCREWQETGSDISGSESKP